MTSLYASAVYLLYLPLTFLPCTVQKAIPDENIACFLLSLSAYSLQSRWWNYSLCAESLYEPQTGVYDIQEQYVLPDILFIMANFTGKLSCQTFHFECPRHTHRISKSNLLFLDKGREAQYLLLVEGQQTGADNSKNRKVYLQVPRLLISHWHSHPHAA